MARFLALLAALLWFSLSRAGGDTVVVALTGDVLMANTFGEYRLPTSGGELLFKESAPVLQRADLALCNLEGPLCDTSLSMHGKDRPHRYAFRCPTDYVGQIADAGYDFVSLANNHIHDFGYAGIRQTVSALDSVQVKYAGVKGYAKYAVVARNGVRYGICAFGFNAYTYKLSDTTLVKKILDELCRKSDVQIVSFHGGAEGSEASVLPYGEERYFGERRGNLRFFAHFCIDHGADIVYGHGPHVLRCVECYKGRFIAYSLGNFCTPFGVAVTGKCGLSAIILARVRRNGEFVGGQIYSYKQRSGVGPRYDYSHAATLLIKELTESDSAGATISVSKYGELRTK